jgi:iron(III) transport system permease protein
MSRPVVLARTDRTLTAVAQAVAGAIVVIAILAPVGMLIFASLRTDTPGSPFARWTLDNISQVYATTALLTPLINSLITCVPGTMIAVALGSLFAWLVHRTDASGHSWLEPILISPIYFSPLSLAAGWIILASPRVGLINLMWPVPGGIVNVYSLTTIILFIGLYYAPYVFLIMSGSLRELDGGYEDASAILGGKALRTLRSVTLPMLRPQLLASSLLVFILSMSMFAEPALFGARFNFTNLPLAIYQAAFSIPANFGAAAAIGTVMLIGALVGVFLYRWALASAERFITTQSRGFVLNRVSLGPLRYIAAVVMWVYVSAVFILPVVALIFASVMRLLSPRPSFALLTLDHYATAFKNPLVLQAISNTLVISFVVATITTVFGFLVAYTIVRRKGPEAVLLDTVTILPIGVPAIVLSLGFLWSYLWSPIGIYGTLWATIIALSTLIIPNTMRALDAAIRQVGTDVEFAARLLGAGPGRRMIQIVLPMIRGPLISAWLLAFMLTTIQVSAPIILRTPGQELLSVVIWTLITDAGDINQAAVVSLVQALMAGIVVLIARRFNRKI